MDNSGGSTPPPPSPPPPDNHGFGAGAGGGSPIPPRGIGDILSAAFDVYRSNAADLVTIVAIVVVPLTFISALLSNVVFSADTQRVLDPLTGSVEEVTLNRSVGGAVAVALLGAIISIIITAMLQAALIRAAAQASIGDTVDAKASYRFGFRKIGSVILISILVALVVGGGAVALVLVGVLTDQLVFLFIIAAVVWGVFAGTRLSVSVPSLVVESVRGTGALGRSWNLVQGHFWHVLATVLVTAILVGIVSGVIGALGGSNWFLSWIFGAIAQIITAPFAALVTVILYVDLRARSEGLTTDQLRADLA